MPRRIFRTADGSLVTVDETPTGYKITRADGTVTFVKG